MFTRLIIRNLKGSRLWSTASSPVTDNLAASLNMTDGCVKRLKDLYSNEPSRLLRISVEGGGCSGFQYLFSLDTMLEEEDCIIEKNDVKIVVDRQSLEFLEGATVDFQSELIRSSFRILQNPKADSGCSCGASFSLKVD